MAQATVAAYLKFNTGSADQPTIRIVGDTTNPDFTGAIELASWMIKSTDPRFNASDRRLGTGSGRLAFTKAPGNADVLLFNWLQGGWTLDSALMTMLRPSQRLQVQLSAVRPTAWNAAASGVGMEIAYEQVRMQYSLQAADGSWIPMDGGVSSGSGWSPTSANWAS